MAKSYAAPSVETLGSGSIQGNLNVWYHVDTFVYDTYIYVTQWEHVWLYDANKNTILFLEPK